MKLIVTLLHEEAGLNSATRLFRGRPVLAHTLARLLTAEFEAQAIVLAFDDQASAAQPICERLHATLHTQPRRPMAQVDAVTIAMRFCDGWRNALHRTCCFDRGFHAGAIATLLDADEPCLVIDGASGLLDVSLLHELSRTAKANPSESIIFSPATPGLAGVLLRQPLIAELAKTRGHPGAAFHYAPDRPARDPLSSPACALTPAPLTRTTHHFLLNSDRQIRKFTTAPTTLSSLELLAHADSRERPDSTLVRELTLELTTRRHSTPRFSPLCTADAASLRILQRGDIDPTLARRAISDLAHADDARLTFAGIGDPMLHPACLELIAFAATEGIAAIHLETDLIELPDAAALLQSGVHVISIHLPAVLSSTYQQLMQIDAMPRVLENIRSLVAARATLGRATPLLVPTFTKCQLNLGEMEQWYDQWLLALRSATIRGPVDFGGLIDNIGVADMGALGRVKSCDVCVLSDGSIVVDEHNILGSSAVGNIASLSLHAASILEIA